MVKFYSLLTALLFSTLLHAQSLATIKTKVILQHYRQAKDEIDKALMNVSFTSKPETYLLKATIYVSLANDISIKGTTEENALLMEGETSFNRYSQLDPNLTLLTDPLYQNTIFTLYSGFYTTGYKDYETGQWQSCYEKLKKAVVFSDLLINKKILNVTLDTNVLILAGIAAEKSNSKDEAVQYYGRLADKKITGDGFESIYRFLISYYFEKNDMVAFEKYKGFGEQLYPNSEFFKYDKIDFAIGLKENFNAKVKALEDVLATDPDNYKANEILGELIYDTLNSSYEGAILPSNAAELEKEMIDAFSKSAIAKPGLETPNLYMGDHFINKAVKINEAREVHANDMKARTKSGIKASKEDIAKRDLLDIQYGEALESARDPYEKAAAIFSAKPKSEDKKQAIINQQQYRKVVSYLADVFAYKKIQSKSNTAELAKYTAEEKKWNDAYHKLSSENLGQSDKLVVKKNENKPLEIVETVERTTKKDEETRNPSKSDGLKPQSTQPLTQVGKYFALVIGVSEYNDSRLIIPNPVKDARLLASLLTQRYTFSESSVFLVLNPTREKIFAELYHLRKLVGPNDNLLIFFAGHGYWDEDTKQGYWWPKDAGSENSSYWLSNSDLREQIRGIKSAHTLLISDACFSGGIFRTRSGMDITKASLDIQMLYKMPSRRAMTSGTMTKVPDESVFLQFLTKRLSANQTKFLGAQELYESFRIAVINNSKVVPQEGVIAETGDEGGDFIFILKE